MRILGARLCLAEGESMTEIKAGDVVDHIEGWEELDQEDFPVVERVDSVTFPDDPVAFFVGGGFWRTSRLVKVKS